MAVQLLAMSHSPLIGFNDPGPEVVAELDSNLETFKKIIADFKPDYIISFAPDHFNGFFYDRMPPFCLGFAAHSVGDYGSTEADMDVPFEKAEELANYIMDKGVDLPVSHMMDVDHGAAQPMEQLFGAVDGFKNVPFFVNGVARPMIPMSKIRGLGEAVGDFIKDHPDERILLLASGGLSHDPPVPNYKTGDAETRQYLLHGGRPTPQFRQARQERVIKAAYDYAHGDNPTRDINPEWDAAFLDMCAGADPTAFDGLTPDDMDEEAGHSSHEVRTWVAAFSALARATDNNYQVDFRYYRPIPEYMAGFGMMAAH